MLTHIDAILEIRDGLLGICCDQCDRVGRSDKEVVSEDHVPITIT